MIEASDPRVSAPRHDAPISQAGKRWALLLLLTVYASNLSDRAILSTVGQAIKLDLGLSDLQLGVLGGLTFALF